MFGQPATRNEEGWRLCWWRWNVRSPYIIVVYYSDMFSEANCHKARFTVGLVPF